MKSIFYIPLLCLLTGGIIEAAEEAAIDKNGSTSITKEETVNEGDIKDWLLMVPSAGNPELKIPPQALENFSKILKNMSPTTSIDDVPIEILLQEPDLLKGILVTGSFYIKSTAITLANLYNWISPISFGPLLRTISSPAVYSYAHKITEGDITNFPPIPLKKVYDLFDGDPDRKAFASFPLRKRSFHFDTNGFNGFGKGYVGYAIVQDFAYGQRLVQPGEEYAEISKDVTKNPLDSLVSLKEHILLSEWLNLRFTKTNPGNLRKVGSTFKDMFGNSCLIYEVVSDPESLFLLVMRKPEKEYLELVEIWKEVWRRNHSEASLKDMLTTGAEGAAKK